MDRGEMKITTLGYKHESVTRVEVIDENGRSYVNFDPNNDVKVSLQDDNKTMKIFITKKVNNHNKE